MLEICGKVDIHYTLSIMA